MRRWRKRGSGAVVLWWKKKGGMEGEEGRTDGVKEGKGKQAWREGKEERGAEMDGGRGDWLFGFDSMCQIDCG